MRRLEQSWRTRVVARVDEVPRLRNEVVALLEQECPEADLEAVALIATELVANVVRHAYPDGTRGWSRSTSTAPAPARLPSRSATGAAGSMPTQR
jgi:anti-sigma regulatory factor (Ser/Thr protein kinase)